MQRIPARFGATLAWACVMTVCLAGCGGGGKIAPPDNPTPSPGVSPPPTPPGTERSPASIDIDGELPARPGAATLGLRLFDGDDAPIGSAALTATLDGQALAPITTDDDGIARVALSAAQLTAGNHALMVRFAGNATHSPTSRTFDLTLEAEAPRTATRLEASATFEMIAASGGAIGVRLLGESGEPVAGAEIELDGLPGGPRSAETSATGTARFEIEGGAPVGSYALNFVFGGDTRRAGSRKDATLRIIRGVVASETRVVAPDSLSIGQAAMIDVIVEADGAPVPGGSVHVEIFGASGQRVESTQTTDGGGRVHVPILATEGMGVGNWRVVARFAGVDGVSPGTGVADFTVARGETGAIVGGAPNPVAYGGTITFGGQLTSIEGRYGIGGRELQFRTEDGSVLASGVTDGNGSAGATFHAALEPGTYSVTSNFAGDGLYQPTTSGTFTFTIGKCDVNIRTLDASGPRSGSAPLRCFVTRATDGAPAGGVTVKFYLGSEYIRSDVSNPSGYAAIGIPLAGRSPGTRVLRAVFEGDSRHKGGEGRATLTILP